MMKQILGIGNALVDVMTIINDDNILRKFSLPKGSMQLVDMEKSLLVKAETVNLKRSFASGGSAANTIHGLAMLGVNTGFIGSVGKDDTGDFFENDLKTAGVKTFLSRRNSITGTAVALVSPDSERTFATHLGAAVELEAHDLDASSFRDYDILYLEGYLIFNKPLVERACILAKENKMKIALDLASYNVVDAKLGDFKEIIEKYVDIVFANEDEAKSFTGLNPYEALSTISQLCDVVVIKVGKEG
jgi:sugar/nucleoside kinase (ribokinase family)